MERSLSKPILQNLGPKITILTGPRQVGKTTIAKDLSKSVSYYNYDIKKDINVFLKNQWDKSTEVVIFDEIHKMKKWKLWLKGHFDDDQFKDQFAVVTGSARLSQLKKVGDSLAGRYSEFRLHPLDLKELKGHQTAEKNFKKLLEFGGFPEPFLKMNLDQSRVWRRSHTDVILRQDLLSLEVIRDLNSIELLLELLSTRVGSMVSFNSLAEDLQVSDMTIKRWLRLLEDLYVVFRVSAISKNVTRGLSKAGKYYFYDLGRVNSDHGAKVENLVALAIRKELDFIEDTKGLRASMNFIRNREKNEIDFYVQVQGLQPKMIEVKVGDSNPSKNFHILSKNIKNVDCIQLVADLDRRFDTKDGISVEPLANFLEKLDLTKS